MSLQGSVALRRCVATRCRSAGPPLGVAAASASAVGGGSRTAAPAHMFSTTTGTNLNGPYHTSPFEPFEWHPVCEFKLKDFAHHWLTAVFTDDALCIEGPPG